MNRFLPILIIFLFSLTVYGQGVKLVPISSGFTRPVDLAQDPKTSNLIVVEKVGTAIAVAEPNYNFLTITDRVRSQESEQGLLGLVFHPGYPGDPYIFVHYTRSNGDSRIARFNVNQTTNVADPGSEKMIMNIPQPYSNHNGGDLNFGPDGYLYIGMGDGGSGGDPENRAQNRQTLLGKMLRIDIDSGSEPYLIPEDNPFVDDSTTLDEIWSLGLRNPWRFSFDMGTGDMYIADVGQSAWEEINFRPASSAGGENYGWRCYEGEAPFNMTGPCPTTPVDPIYDYASSSSLGCSVTGGFVYRKEDSDPLFGSFIYGDFCSGQIWSLTRNGDTWVNDDLIDVGGGELSSFGQGIDGAVYIVTYDGGEVFELKSNSTNIESQNLSAVTISPNPAIQNIVLHIQQGQNSINDVTLTDVQGKLLWQRKGKVDQQLSIPVQDFETGVYLVSYMENNVRKTQKVFVTK